jgi:hypothetical protein
MSRLPSDETLVFGEISLLGLTTGHPPGLNPDVSAPVVDTSGGFFFGLEGRLGQVARVWEKVGVSVSEMAPAATRPTANAQAVLQRGDQR